METPLRQARKSRGLSVKDVAEAVGTDPSNMSRIETGHHAPPVELARAIYKFYAGELDIVDLYDPTFRDEVGIVEASGNSWYRVKTRHGDHSVHGLDALHALFGRLAARGRS